MPVPLLIHWIVRISPWTGYYLTDPLGSLEQHQLPCLEYSVRGN